MGQGTFSFILRGHGVFLGLIEGTWDILVINLMVREF